MYLFLSKPFSEAFIMDFYLLLFWLIAFDIKLGNSAIAGSVSKVVGGAASEVISGVILNDNNKPSNDNDLNPLNQFNHKAKLLYENFQLAIREDFKKSIS